MAQIFMKEDVIKLLNNKQVFFIGDSNIRAMYKDMIQLIVGNNLISLAGLKTKQEPSFNGDHLYAKSEKTNGRHYREERVFEINNDTFKFSARYYFITSCYSEYVQEIFQMIKIMNPDVVVYSSCLWDISRWGPESVKKYVQKFPTFIERLQKVLSPNCYFVWLTTPMLSKVIIAGGLILQDIGFLKQGLRHLVIEANQFTSKLISEAGFNVLDLQYYTRLQVHRREQDGIHWDPVMVRYFTSLLLTQVSMAWEIPLPENSTPTKALKILQDKDLQRPRPPDIEPRVQFRGTNNKDGHFDHVQQKFGSGFPSTLRTPDYYNTQMNGNMNNFTSNERNFPSSNFQDIAFTNNPFPHNSDFPPNNFQTGGPTNNYQNRNDWQPNPYAQNSDFQPNNFQANATSNNNFQFSYPDQSYDFPPNFQTNGPTNTGQNHNFFHPNTQVPGSNFSNFDEMNERDRLARMSFFPNYSHPQHSDNQFPMQRNVVRNTATRGKRGGRNRNRSRPFNKKRKC